MTFDQLGLSKPLLKAIEKKNYTNPSPIQEKAIPVILEKKDVLASAQTGTGKTAGFTLPLLQILSEKPIKRRVIRALILTPTRELAAQVHENVVEYSEFLPIRSTVIFGGVKQHSQVKTLQRGVDILVATPGRLLDLISQKIISLRDIEFLILDEADRMLDMGFLRDIKKILTIVPKERQNLLFSATFSKEIKTLAKNILNNPVWVETVPENTAAEMVVQKAYAIDQKKKIIFITDLIAKENWQQVLIFTRTKHRANRLAEKLLKSDISAAAIHGNKSQNARTKALQGFKNGTIRVLVATDIAARGLDIPLLPHVINFELPNVPEDYVHRIGRTGRAGESGEAISLVAADEKAYLRAIEKLVGKKIVTEIVEGFEPLEKESSNSKPKKNFSRNSRSGNESRRNNRNSSRK